MSRPGSIRHFMNYMFKDTSNRLLLAFTGFIVGVFIPLMYFVDKTGMKRRWNYLPYGYEPSWWPTAKGCMAGLFVIWTGITIYTYIKYRKYTRS